MVFDKVKNQVERNPRKEDPKAGMKSAKIGVDKYDGIRPAVKPDKSKKPKKK
jgi:hypothetical protein